MYNIVSVEYSFCFKMKVNFETFLKLKKKCKIILKNSKTQYKYNFNSKQNKIYNNKKRNGTKNLVERRSCLSNLL